MLQSIDFGALVQAAELPGTEMVPAAHALRTLLALKLLGKERASHVTELVFDPGIALFADLNVVPKRSFLAEYSALVDPRSDLRRPLIERFSYEKGKSEVGVRDNQGRSWRGFHHHLAIVMFGVPLTPQNNASTVVEGPWG